MPNARRALLLFAVVLAASALVALATGPRGDDSSPPALTEAPPRPRTDAVDTEVRFRAGTRPVNREVRPQAATTVVVSVPRPGQVELEGLGLVAPADTSTPASFQVADASPGRYRVLFTPAGTSEAQPAGTLVVRR